MKRILGMILALCLLAAPGLSEEVREGLRLDVDGRALTLNFDSSEEYSSVADGRVTASFYVYTDNSDRLYELTMTFPEDVQPGDVVDAPFALASSPESQVAAIFSTQTEAMYYFAGIVDGRIYPDGASFAVAFDAVDDTGAGRTYTGRLTAHMVGMDMYAGPGAEARALDIADAPFSFTMPGGNRLPDAPAPSDSYNPFDTAPPPQDFPEPSPTRDEVKV